MKRIDEMTPIEIVLEEARQAVSEGKMTKEQYIELESNFKKKQTTSPPKIAIIGKAGVGKSTTINSLFSVEDFVVDVINIDAPDGENGKNLVSDIKTGSVKAIRKRFNLKNGTCLDIIDMPGLGDDIETDKEHEVIYRRVLPTCDVVLYIMESDDRSYSEDQRILRDVVIPCCKDIRKKIVIAINKVDQIGEKNGILWDIRINQPSREQKDLIEIKLEDVQKRFSSEFGVSKEQIVCYSGLKRYHLNDLLLALINVNPFIDPTGVAPWEKLMLPEFLEKWKLAEKILGESE